MATKYLINKLVAVGRTENGLAKSKGFRLMAILGVMLLWSFYSLASVPAARAQNAANLAIESPGATVDGNIVNFRTTSGLNAADWRYWWVVRGPKNQWTFAGPSGNLDLPPGDYRATVTARDRYGDTAYQDTSTFRVESPTAGGTAGGRSAGNVNYRNDGRVNRGRTSGDGLYGRYDVQGDNYYGRPGDGYRDSENYYPDNEGNNSGYGDEYYDCDYGNRYGDSQYDGAGYTYDNMDSNTPYVDGSNGQYEGNFGGGSDNGYGGYNTAGYDGGQYEDGYHQDGGGYESDPCGDGSLDSYDEGEYNY